MKGIRKRVIPLFFALLFNSETFPQSIHDVPSQDWPPSNHKDKWNVIKTDRQTCWYHIKTMYKACDTELQKTDNSNIQPRLSQDYLPSQKPSVNQIRDFQSRPPIQQPRNTIDRIKPITIQDKSYPEPGSSIGFLKLFLLIGLIWLVKYTYFKPKNPVIHPRPLPNKRASSKTVTLTNNLSELEQEFEKGYSKYKWPNSTQTSSAKSNAEQDTAIAGHAIENIRNKLNVDQSQHEKSRDFPSIDKWQQPTHEFSWTKEFLNILEWKRFEELGVEFLKIQYPDHIIQNTKIGADGGIDIEIFDPFGQLIAIGQCKSWKKVVGVEPVRALLGVMASKNITNGIFLSTSEFSKDAIRFGKENSLALYDGDYIVNYINRLDVTSRIKLNKVATSGDFWTPTCVNCNIKMVKRCIKSGIKAGKEFWGCINYPRCKNKMYISTQSFTKKSKYF